MEATITSENKSLITLLWAAAHKSALDDNRAYTYMNGEKFWLHLGVAEMTEKAYESFNLYGQTVDIGSKNILQLARVVENGLKELGVVVPDSFKIEYEPHAIGKGSKIKVTLDKGVLKGYFKGVRGSLIYSGSSDWFVPMALLGEVVSVSSRDEGRGLLESKRDWELRMFPFEQEQISLARKEIENGVDPKKINAAYESRFVEEAYRRINRC